MQVQDQLAQDYFPCITDLRNFVHITYWSNFHHITQTLFDLLPFGQLFGGSHFYAFSDYQLDQIANEAQRNLLFWSLGNVTTFNRQHTRELTLFYNDTFFWHYIIPSQEEEIKQHLLEGHQVRFLSQFQLLQTKVKLEFCEIRLRSNPDITYQFVNTDSQIYTYQWTNNYWKTNIVNWEVNLVNPQTFHIPISEPNNWGREEAFAIQLCIIQERNDDLGDQSDQYWSSVDNTPEMSTSCADTPVSEYQRSRAFDSILNTSPPVPYPTLCSCTPDFCICLENDIPFPETLPTPPSIALWDPKNSNYPIHRLHYN